jgi:hypothetical protein
LRVDRAGSFNMAIAETPAGRQGFSYVFFK